MRAAADRNLGIFAAQAATLVGHTSMNQRHDLRDHQHNHEQQGAGKVSPIECHGDAVAARLAQGGGGPRDWFTQETTKVF